MVVYINTAISICNAHVKEKFTCTSYNSVKNLTITFTCALKHGKKKKH